MLTSAFFICLLCVVEGQNFGPAKWEEFRVIFEWNSLEYTWRDESHRKNAISKSEFIPENNVLYGVKEWKDNLYLTVPRWKEGVPATLAFVPLSLRGHNASPLLKPFPSWDMQSVGNCSALQSVFSVEIDSLGRIWVVDSGRVNTIGNRSFESPKCSPKVLVFDLNDFLGHNLQFTTPSPSNSQAYNRYDSIPVKQTAFFEFPENVVSKEGSLLTDVVVDGDFAYISDSGDSDPGIIVYSLKESRAWKVRDSRSMVADLEVRKLFVNGKEVEYEFNVQGLALSPIIRSREGERRILYYSPLNSDVLYSLPTDVIKDQASRTISTAVRKVGIREGPSQGMVIDSRGVLYYGLITRNAVARWDTRLPFDHNQHVITQDPQLLQWPSSFGFDTKGFLHLVSNKLQNFLSKGGRVNMTEPNFRIISAYTGSRSYMYEEEDSVQPGGYVPFQEMNVSWPNSAQGRGFTSEESQVRVNHPPDEVHEQPKASGKTSAAALPRVLPLLLGSMVVVGVLM